MSSSKIFTIISKQILSGKVFFMDKKNDFSNEPSLKPVTICHQKIVVKML